MCTPVINFHEKKILGQPAMLYVKGGNNTIKTYIIGSELKNNFDSHMVCLSNRFFAFLCGRRSEFYMQLTFSNRRPRFLN